MLMAWAAIIGCRYIRVRMCDLSAINKMAVIEQRNAAVIRNKQQQQENLYVRQT